MRHAVIIHVLHRIHTVHDVRRSASVGNVVVIGSIRSVVVGSRIIRSVVIRHGRCGR